MQALVSPGDRVAVGTPLFSGITVTDRAYLAWDMSANDAIYFERGTPLAGIQLQVRENNRTVPTKMDLSVTSKVYEPKTNPVYLPSPIAGVDGLRHGRRRGSCLLRPKARASTSMEALSPHPP